MAQAANSHVQNQTQVDGTAIRMWLYFITAIIAVMMLVGAATRLTDSGLSITEWEPISGIIPPFTAADWNVEFLKYQTTDEFKTQNSNMTMDQFKVIYWWEWGHRFLGRLIGLAVLIPLIVFWRAGRLSASMKRSGLVVFVLICIQGAIGWWMVKSGLVNRVDVSQIRLAVHLSMAALILCYVLWLARSIAPHTQQRASYGREHAPWLFVLVMIQVFLGGLVAGLDAGMAYNTWPLMNGVWIPEGLLVITPAWLNFTDNALTVQFVHRVTAYLLWAAVAWHAVAMVRTLPGTTHAHRAVLLFAIVTGQAIIGIVTLLLQVPLWWGLAHQAGAIAVLVFMTAHWRALTFEQAGTSRNTSMPVNALHGSA